MVLECTKKNENFS